MAPRKPTSATSTTAKPRATKKRTTATKSPGREQTFVSKSKKPVISGGTWAALLIVAALIGFTVYLNRKKDAVVANATPVSGPAYLFTSTDGLPSSIEVKAADGTGEVRVVRGADNAWALELPEKAEADQSLAEEAASQISSFSVMSELNASPDIFGLDKPAYVITIGFTGGSQHVLEIGGMTPTQSGYYVRVDKKKMIIIEISGIEALLNLVSAPPYLNTPTPSPIPPTETPTPLPLPSQVNPAATSTP